MFWGMASVGLVVSDETAEEVPAAELPEEGEDAAFWELVQPARIAAKETRIISTTTVLAFIPENDRRNYL
jgi:hypothetical protein